MSAGFVFDQPHYDALNKARRDAMERLLGSLGRELNLRTAIDVGCGLGHFSGLLRSLGLDVTAVDGRAENVEEVANRNPGMKVHTVNAEDPSLRAFGKFDLVFCFGLLYHLENPFLAIRHLEAMTGRLLLVEGVIFPGDVPVMGLVDEGATKDQGLNHVAFYPTESCLAKMFYRAGFPFVYKLATMPDHPGYRSAKGLPRTRTILAASFESIGSQLLHPIPEPVIPFQPWDAASVVASMRALNLSRGLRASWVMQKLESLRRLLAQAKPRRREAQI